MSIETPATAPSRRPGEGADRPLPRIARANFPARPRHGPLHTATVAPATPLPASNKPHPLAAFRLCFDARRATDGGSFTVFRRAPPIVVGRPPCNALSRIVALRAARRAPRAFTQLSKNLVLPARHRTLAQSVGDTNYSYGLIYMRERCRMDNSITIL